MNINPHEIVVKVRDILALDSRTKDINWYLGRQTLDGLKDNAHGSGGVSLGDGQMDQRTMGQGAVGPVGVEALFDVIVPLRFWSWGDGADSAIAKAEELRNDGLNSAWSTLWDKQNLDLPRSVFFRLSWRTSSNPVASPAYAEATLFVHVTVYDPPA